MAKETKEQIRAKRNWKKEANKCSNCTHYMLTAKYEPATCEIDGFKIGGASCCDAHVRKPA